MIRLIAVVCGLLLSNLGFAQSWPSKPVRVIVNVAAGGESPEEFAAFVRGEVQKWGKVIKDAKITAQ